MTFALHRWNRDTLLARLRASDAIDRATDVEPTPAARERLHLLSVGDRLEANVISDADAIVEFDAIRRTAERLTAHRALVDD